MEIWQLIIMVLVSVLVGALLPLFLMLTATLAAVRQRITENGTRFDDTMNRIHAVSERLEMASRGLEGSEDDIARFVQAVGSLTDRLTQAEKSVKMAASIGSAVGPAIAAFVEGLRQPSTSPVSTGPIAQQPDTGGEEHE